MLMYSGRFEQALALIDRVVGRPVGIPAWYFDLMRLQVLGLANPATNQAEAVARTLDSVQRGPGFAENAALFAAAVGRADDCFRVMEALLLDVGGPVATRRFTPEQERFDNKRNRTAFLFEPTLLRIREDDRFRQLTGRVGLENYWRESGTKPDYRA